MQVALTLVLYFGVAIIEGDLMDKIQKHKKGKKLLIFAIVLPSIVAAFRGNTGSDSEMYRIAYEQGINAVHRWVNFEMGYRILVQILHSLYMPYQVLFFVTSFITVSFTLLTILQLKKCIDVRLATYIYITGLYLFSFNAILFFTSAHLPACNMPPEYETFPHIFYPIPLIPHGSRIPQGRRFRTEPLRRRNA